MSDDMIQTTSLKRAVWLFARPLSGAEGYPALAATSLVTFHFCHWGVLVTELSVTDLNVFIHRKRNVPGAREMNLGVFFELHRTTGSEYIVSVSQPFTPAKLNAFWENFSAKHLGETIKRDGEIYASAQRIKTDRPDYLLFENNCQNFAKYLVEEICPGAICPDTIRDILARLLNPPVPLRPLPRYPRLPGTYPISFTSTEDGTFITATSEPWISAVQSRASEEFRRSISDVPPSFEIAHENWSSVITSQRSSIRLSVSLSENKISLERQSHDFTTDHTTIANHPSSSNATRRDHRIENRTIKTLDTTVLHETELRMISGVDVKDILSLDATSWMGLESPLDWTCIQEDNKSLVDLTKDDTQRLRGEFHVSFEFVTPTMNQWIFGSLMNKVGTKGNPKKPDTSLCILLRTVLLLFHHSSDLQSQTGKLDLYGALYLSRSGKFPIAEKDWCYDISESVAPGNRGLRRIPRVTIHMGDAEGEHTLVHLRPANSHARSASNLSSESEQWVKALTKSFSHSSQSWDFAYCNCLSVGYISAIGFIVQLESEIDQYICEMQIPTSALRFSVLRDCYFKWFRSQPRPFKDGLSQMLVVQFAFQNRQGKFVPVSPDFPEDTDYSWRMFSYAQFWVLPVETETDLWANYPGAPTLQELESIQEE